MIARALTNFSAHDRGLFVGLRDRRASLDLFTIGACQLDWIHSLKFVAVCALTLSVAACATEPKVDALIDATSNGRVRVVGARGPLSDRESEAILERVTRENPKSGVLERHIAFQQALVDAPLIAGNKVELLRDGPETFAAMFAAIDGAKQSLELEYFTLEDVEFNGRRLADLLVYKASRGIRIRIIYDAIGSIATPPSFFERLRQAGIAVLEFNPINPLTLNHRDHRKIVISDNAVGIVGGVNLSTVYSSVPFSKPQPQPPGDESATRWRDTDLKLIGPAIAELQRLFLEDWEKQSGTALQTPLATGPYPLAGNEIVRVIGSTPDDPLPLHYIALLSAIHHAEERIWMSAAYFVPTQRALQELINAAKRGVDVRLLLPSQSDSAKALAAGRSHYSDLLEAGVKIFEARDVILHAKSEVIDGVWSAIGSSNFDRRSVLFNDEVDVVVLGRTTGTRMEAMFNDDLRSTDRIEPQTWANRALTERFAELTARLLWEYWL
jgi:cardiolipin synthase